MRLPSWLLLLLCAAPLALSGCAAAQTQEEEESPLPTSAQAGDTTIVAVAPSQKCCPHPTIWDTLGVQQIAGFAQGLVNRVQAILGMRFPALEPRPPILPLTDPANLESDNPAVATAAEAKAEEDAAPQKIKALRYLATLGCGGCYPDVEDALLAALDDCTEAVRFEAAKALRSRSGTPCEVCQHGTCCSQKVLEKLQKVAYDMDDEGCYVEPSARVRRQARLALANCGGYVEQPAPVEGPSPEEGPSAEEGPAEEALTATEDSEEETTAAEEPTESTAKADAEVKQASHESAVPPTDRSASSPGALLARVNGEPIYENQVLPQVEVELAGLPPHMAGPQRAKLRQDLVRRELYRVIERKLICQDARRRMSAVQLASFADSRRQEAARIPAELPEAGFASLAEEEDALAASWLQQAVPVDEVVSHGAMVAYYEANKNRFLRPAEVRWERVSVLRDSYPTRSAAFAVIDYLRERSTGADVEPPSGASFQGVRSEVHEWTQRDCIASQALAGFLFTQPVGSVSQVFEDSEALYVLRLLARRPPGHASFHEVADVIRSEIVQGRRRHLQQAYLEGLRQRATVWTVFDRPRAQPPRQGTRRLPARPTAAATPPARPFPPGSTSRRRDPEPPPSKPASSDREPHQPGPGEPSSATPPPSPPPPAPERPEAGGRPTELAQASAWTWSRPMWMLRRK